MPRLHAPVDVTLRPVRGTPPSLLNPPPGCPFHPRCDYPELAGPERCRGERPELEPERGHGDACYLTLSQKRELAAAHRIARTATAGTTAEDAGKDAQ
jgi:peptide/nickel transport system ATP-binding protein